MGKENENGTTVTSIQFDEENNEMTQEIITAEEDVVETLTISDDIAKAHFPELMEEQTQEVYEVTDKEGEVVEQWRAVEPDPEKVLSNVEALEKLESEADNEEDKIDIQKILTWAKSSKKKKTATMVI